MKHKLQCSTSLVLHRTPCGGYSIFICLLFSVFCLYLVAGCESARTQKNPLAEQVEMLTGDKKEMMRQIEHLESENKSLQKQINTLHSLPDDLKLKDIYEVQSVRITKYTNLYDKDNDGKSELLIVYLQPVDQDGDIIKVPADVHVQLLEINKDKDPVVLGKWHLTPEQLKKTWFNSFMKTHYRLNFDITGRVDTYEKPLTVMVTFTDCLTGKVFEVQTLIKPQ